MNLLQLNEIFEGKYVDELKKSEVIKTITENDLNEFRELLSISDSFSEGLNLTESYAEYFQTYEILGKSVNEDLKEDLFYAAKLGFFYEGIPSKIVYLLRKSLRKYNTPNNAISALDVRSISRYLKKGSLPEGVTLKMIMENIIGREFETITQYRRSVHFKEVTEVYVQNTDRVLVLPKELAVFVESQKDLESVQYVKNIGVCVHDIPIRTLGGKIGITFNEYDLRECR